MSAYSQEQLADLVGHYRQAAIAAFEAERLATRDFSFAAPREVAFYSVQQLDRFGVIDEMLQEMVGGEDQREYRKLINAALLTRSLSDEEASRLGQLDSEISNLFHAARTQASAAGDSDQRRYLEGLDIVHMVLLLAFEPLSNALIAEESRTAPGASAADSASALFLLRGGDAVEVFLSDLRQQVDELANRPESDPLAHVFLLRENPSVVSALAYGLAAALDESSLQSLVLRACLLVGEEFPLSPVHQEVMAAATVVLEQGGAVDEARLHQCAKMLNEQAATLNQELAFADDSMWGEPRADLPYELAGNGSQLALALAGKDDPLEARQQWARTLATAQSLLANGVEHIKYEQSITALLNAAATIERPQLSASDSPPTLPSAPADLTGPGHES
jgi:hypothetical protein